MTDPQKLVPRIREFWVAIMLLFEAPLVAVIIWHVLWCTRFMSFILTSRQDFAKDSLALPQDSEMASVPEGRWAAVARPTGPLRAMTKRLLPSESRSFDLTKGSSEVREWLKRWEARNRETFISILIMDDVVSIIVYMMVISVLSLLVTDGLHLVGVLTGQRIDVALRYTPMLHECTLWQSDLFALVSSACWAVTLLMCMGLCLRANSMVHQEASFINEQKFRMWLPRTELGAQELGPQELLVRAAMLEHLVEHIKHNSHMATILGFPITQTLFDKIFMAQILGAITYVVSKLMAVDLF
eukprot:CAMPEP_0171244548 /NCGR_PEP_ID=MMETSP0790-20130122/46916_1 /TAXON_ID=2925 /ORGANISM="Alexandrium catenella, Strain OF101" /LENGTH=298 /DNA_ID=CAMNT_0011711689 /DNA_START=12 /DNA_END=908 /DNA_ORIENTATION=-